MKRGTPILVAATVLCLMALVGAGLGLGALNGGGVVEVAGITVFRLGGGSSRQAAEILKNSPTEPRKLDRADALSHQTLATAPFENGSWLRLVQSDSLRNGGHLSPKGLAALKMSYDLIAVDNIFGVARVGLALEHWNDLSPEISKAVGEEATILGNNGGRKWALIERIRQVRNPRGRLIGELWIMGFPS